MATEDNSNDDASASTDAAAASNPPEQEEKTEASSGTQTPAAPASAEGAADAASPMAERPRAWQGIVGVIAGVAATFFLTFGFLLNGLVPPEGPTNGPAFAAADARAFIAILILVLYVFSLQEPGGATPKEIAAARCKRDQHWRTAGIAFAVLTVILGGTYYILRGSYVFLFPPGPNATERLAGLHRKPDIPSQFASDDNAKLFDDMNTQTDEIWPPDSIRDAKLLLCGMYVLFALSLAATFLVCAEVIRRKLEPRRESGGKQLPSATSPDVPEEKKT